MQPAAEPGANGTRPSTPRLAGLLESAVTLTGATAALYLIGLVYGQGYFGRFGIQFAYFGLPMSFYLYRSILPVVLVVVVFGGATLIDFAKPTTAAQALVGNYPALAGIVVTVFALVASAGLSESLGPVAPLVLLFLFFVYIAVRHRYSLMHNVRQRDVGAVLAFSLLAFLTAAAVAYAEGNRAAGATIEGDEDRALRVTLRMKDPAASLIEGKDLILVLVRDESYFVVERQSPAPEHPRLYVVPRDQVAGAVIERAGG